MAEAPRGNDSRIETDSADASPQTFQNEQVPTLLDGDEFREFIDFMPVDLREDNYDVLVISSPKDRQEAEKFDKALSNVKFNYRNCPRQPIVKLIDDFRGNEYGSLDFLVGRSTYIFLFCTKCFFEETWSSLVSNACLAKAVCDLSKRWCVVPVLTKPRQFRDFDLDLLLQGIRPIEYFGNPTFWNEVISKMLAARAPMRIERDVRLNEERRRHFEENKTKLIKMHSESMNPVVSRRHGQGLSERSYIEVDRPVFRDRGNRQTASNGNSEALSPLSGTGMSENYSRGYLNSIDNNSRSSDESWKSSDSDSCLPQPRTFGMNSNFPSVGFSSYRNSSLNVVDNSSNCSSNSNNNSICTDRPLVCRQQYLPSQQRPMYDSRNINSMGSFTSCDSSTSNSSLLPERKVSNGTDVNLNGPHFMCENISLSELCFSQSDTSNPDNISQFVGRDVTHSANALPVNLSQDKPADDQGRSAQKTSENPTAAQSITHIHNIHRHYHIAQAQSVIIGDNGTINNNQELCDEDASDGSSFSGDTDNEDPHRPTPQTVAEQGGVARNIDIGRANAEHGLVDHPLSEGWRVHEQEDESEDHSIHFQHDSEQTYVKFKAYRH